MAGFEWQAQTSGLKLREDEISWHGAFESDPRFFLRRSKYNLQEMSDLLFGDLADNEIERLLAEFINITGGLSGNQIIFSAIGHKEDDHSQTVAVFDRTVKIGQNVMVTLGRVIDNSFLDQSGDKWNVVLKLHPPCH